MAYWVLTCHGKNGRKGALRLFLHGAEDLPELPQGGLNGIPGFLSLLVGVSADRRMAFALLTFDSTGIGKDGKRFPRPGRVSLPKTSSVLISLTLRVPGQ